MRKITAWGVLWPNVHASRDDGKLCSHCGKEIERDRLSRYCRSCQASYMRAYRVGRPMTEEQRARSNCRSYANVYLARGKLTRLPCMRCGDPDSQMHHEDYNKPLVVLWLCRRCHLAEHSLAAKAARRRTTADPAPGTSAA